MHVSMQCMRLHAHTSPAELKFQAHAPYLLAAVAAAQLVLAARLVLAGRLLLPPLGQGCEPPPRRPCNAWQAAPEGPECHGRMQTAHARRPWARVHRCFKTRNTWFRRNGRTPRTCGVTMAQALTRFACTWAAMSRSSCVTPPGCALAAWRPALASRASEAASARVAAGSAPTAHRHCRPASSTRAPAKALISVPLACSRLCRSAAGCNPAAGSAGASGGATIIDRPDVLLYAMLA